MINKRIAIVDDDPFVVAHLKFNLEQRMPDAEIVGIIEPVAPAGFDVYIVDKDFDGDNRGQDVVHRIRSISPNSLVLAYSAHLDREFLRALLREGCEPRDWGARNPGASRHSSPASGRASGARCENRGPQTARRTWRHAECAPGLRQTRRKRAVTAACSCGWIAARTGSTPRTRPAG